MLNTGTDIYLSVPNATDLSNLVASFDSNAENVYVGSVKQTSGDTPNDFLNPVEYMLVSDNRFHKINVYVFDLPVILLNTPGGAAITSKDDWIDGADITIYNTDGSTAELASAATQVRGRGNSTWGAPKKPYTFKLESKSKVLGMPKSKRWNLLANYYDPSMMKNDIAFKLSSSENCPGLAWTPRGKFVELVLNGKYMGNYYLCEHIKIESNRVNISEQEEGNIDETGGYLIELDTYYDENNKFRSQYLNLPVQLKSPDWAGYDMTYIQNYFNTLEGKIVSGSIESTDYKDSIDVASFVDWWIIQELVGNFEPYHPKSVYMYKDRYLADDHKLHMGPVWDYDYSYFSSPGYWLSIHDNWFWFSHFFEDPSFVTELKTRWNDQKAAYKDVIDNYIDNIASQVSNSVKKDKKYWTPTDEVTFESRVTSLKKGLTSRWNWMDSHINRDDFPAVD